MPDLDVIRLGRVLRPHGIKGEISIEFNADSLFLLDDFIYLAPPQDPPASGRAFGASPARPANPVGLVRYGVAGLRMHKGRPLLLLAGVKDRNAAELLRNLVIYVPSSRLPELEDGEVYLGSLPGLAVYVQGESGEPWHLGVIASVTDASGQELWTILTPDGREALFPATEDFVEEIDLESGRTVIAPPPGLLDLYLK
ncbi:ribosome maturation factor RimM [Desulfovibrio sp. OttesenSCG-928-C14]|nr:ribosome maturation factor RimM [Desulfovibrio sp. OttesenSCG-928-C14]